MEFEWDKAKAETNYKKHHVSFAEAATVFGDPLAITFNDPDHSINENRLITFGISKFNRLLAISHTERSSRIRIISARQMTRKERYIYEEE
ncbi:MAG: BrnT family toxin [Thermodesulfobacteriota bacterium]|nr:BrnT family toxin [Thermodesulfobacteriota bacterium]